MTEVTTVSGRVHKFQGYNWVIKESGQLVVKVGEKNLMTIFPPGQWESIRELDK